MNLPRFCIFAAQSTLERTIMSIRIRHADEMSQEAHEINVTPFIDVMLVLLIIFMVTAPLSTVSVPVDLPAATQQARSRPDKPVYVTVQADHSISVGEEKVSPLTLDAAIAAATQGNKDARIFLRADKTVDYGSLMKVMDQLVIAGYAKVALVLLQKD